MRTSAIAVCGLRKAYGDKVVLDGIDLDVPSGTVFSLLGLLNRLDEHSIDVAEFSMHTPDLDDVFLALTGHASTEEIAQ